MFATTSLSDIKNMKHPVGINNAIMAFIDGECHIFADTGSGSMSTTVHNTYDYERLSEVLYPKNLFNRVTYTYGKPGEKYNRAGRLVLVEDASGGEAYYYGNQGEVVKTVRSVMVSTTDVHTYIYGATYGSWNRVRTMTYPDGEVVIYHYNAAGQIVRLSGNKQGRESVPVDRIGYDKDGHTVYTKLGNGTETTYTYDKQRERLQEMNLTAAGTAIMTNKYQYDAVDNILGITNAVDPTQTNKNNSNNNKAKLGGAFNHTYAYDDLNRLIKANGKAKSASYEMTMTFGRMSEPLTKVQKVDSTKTAQSYDFTYKYEDSNHPTAPTQIGHEHYTYDANGNPTLVENDSLNTERKMYWDEDNRLMVLSDNGKTSRYTYNAGGERIIKSHGDLEGVYINGAPQGITFHETEDYTIYPAPIITVTKNRFTKHYFIGDKRIASKLGTGKFSNVYGISGNNVTAGQKDYAARMMQIEKQREEYYKSLGTPPGVPTMKGATADPDNTHRGYNDIIGDLGDHSVPEGWVQRPEFNDKGDVPGPPIQWSKPEDPDNAQPGYGYIPTDTTNIEDIFFYHSDHLGSTSYITDAKANITQFDAYLPYGELLVDEHSSSEDIPYKFNGKELDSETGLYYYGARYMNPVASIWYGVDPLTEKYITIGAYVYCAGNPIRLIDPDGKGWIQTKVGIYYDPRVHSQKDISKHDAQRGFKFLGDVWSDQKRGISYRKDGSILFKNETDAYKHMWNNANNLYRSPKHCQGKEVGGFILSNGSVLVLPDYNNDRRTSGISDYGYMIGEGRVTKGNEVYHVVAQIHTHQDKTGDPTPSFYSLDGLYDGKIAERMKIPVFVLGHDNNVYGILQNKKSNSIFSLPSPFSTVSSFLRTNKKFSFYVKQNKNKWKLR